MAKFLAHMLCHEFGNIFPSSDPYFATQCQCQSLVLIHATAVYVETVQRPCILIVLFVLKAVPLVSACYFLAGCLAADGLMGCCNNHAQLLPIRNYVCGDAAGEGEEGAQGSDKDTAHRAKLPRHHQAWRVQDWYHAGAPVNLVVILLVPKISSCSARKMLSIIVIIVVRRILCAVTCSFASLEGSAKQRFTWVSIDWAGIIFVPQGGETSCEPHMNPTAP